MLVEMEVDGWLKGWNVEVVEWVEVDEWEDEVGIGIFILVLFGVGRLVVLRLLVVLEFNEEFVDIDVDVEVEVDVEIEVDLVGESLWGLFVFRGGEVKYFDWGEVGGSDMLNGWVVGESEVLVEILLVVVVFGFDFFFKLFIFNDVFFFFKLFGSLYFIVLFGNGCCWVVGEVMDILVKVMLCVMLLKILVFIWDGWLLFCWLREFLEYESWIFFLISLFCV